MLRRPPASVGPGGAACVSHQSRLPSALPLALYECRKPHRQKQNWRPDQESRQQHRENADEPEPSADHFHGNNCRS